MNKEEKISEIFALYEKYGAMDYIGESVSQIEHMVQCAQLAEENGEEDDVILAAFLHDIGHLYALAYPEKANQLMEGYGIKEHEKIGAAYLKQMGSSEKIVKLVGSHVNAKRYLVNRDPNYLAALSEASKKTLEFQGGAMSDKEAELFEKDPLFDHFVLLRLWDEKAKETNKPLPDLVPYKVMLFKHLN